MSTSDASSEEASELRAYIERLERLNQEIKTLNDDKRDLYAEMRSDGFNVPIIKEIVRIRTMDPHAYKEHDALRTLYLTKVGINPNTTAHRDHRGAGDFTKPSDLL